MYDMVMLLCSVYVEAREGYPDEFVEFLKHCDAVEYADAKLRAAVACMKLGLRSLIWQHGLEPSGFEHFHSILRFG